LNSAETRSTSASNSPIELALPFRSNGSQLFLLAGYRSD
jgi:hypothetical protein